MDRSLDEILEERQGSRGGRRGGRRGGGRDHDGGAGGRGGATRRDHERERDYPRDGIKKSHPRENARNIDSDWVHDKFEDNDSRRPTRAPRDDRVEQRGSGREAANSCTIRVENLHYDIEEPELRDLFENIGPLESLRLLYDRNDRSRGVAYVVYASPDLAQRAVRQFDGQNAMGQPIYLSLQQSARPARNPFDSIEKAPRSLYDRIDSSRRSASPNSRNVDRYVPPGGRGGGARSSRSPPRRRGAPRETGRRPGARRENTGGRREPAPRGGGGEGKPQTKGRPRKTAEELDAEMDDYWGSGAPGEGGAAASGQNEGGREPQVATIPQGQNPNAGTTSTAPDDDIDLMVE